MDGQMIATAAAVLTAATAAIALVIESRRHRFALGVQVLLDFERRFDTPEMRKTRAAAAREIRHDAAGDAVDDVFDLLETLGLLTRQGAVDEQLVWSSFYEYVHWYCRVARSYLCEAVEDDDTVWENLRWLDGRLELIERRRRHTRQTSDRVLRQERDFLDREQSLTE